MLCLGKAITASQLRERLMLEAESNPSIRVIENDNKESFDVRFFSQALYSRRLAYRLTCRCVVVVNCSLVS